MKPPSFAPAFVVFFPALAEIAQRHGYALCVHGSLQRDMDLLAMPWTKAASDAETLMEAIRAYASQTLSLMFPHARVASDPEAKPHGRRAWIIHLGNGASIDLSVAPRA